MSLLQKNQDGPESKLPLGQAAQRRIIARATRLQEARQQEVGRGHVTLTQLMEAAREAGLDPDLVRAAASQEAEARQVRRHLWLASPSLLSLLSLLSIPTHNGGWLVFLSATAFTAFLAPTSAKAVKAPDNGG